MPCRLGRSTSHESAIRCDVRSIAAAARAVLVDTARAVGEPVSGIRTDDRRRGGAARIRTRFDATGCGHARTGDARLLAAAGLDQQALSHGGDSVDFHDGTDRLLLLPRRPVRRTARSQHLVLEVDAGLQSDHGAVQGQHSFRGPAADRIRDGAVYATDHAADEYCDPACEQPRHRFAVDAAGAAADDTDTDLRTVHAGAVARPDLRMAAAGIGLRPPLGISVGRIAAVGAGRAGAYRLRQLASL